jgi:hypothetical protein
MVPLAEGILNGIIHALQEGSTDLAYLIFRGVGLPVLHRGFVLTLLSPMIEVARESGGVCTVSFLFPDNPNSYRS